MDISHANTCIDTFYDVANRLPATWSGRGVWGPQQTAVTLVCLRRPGKTQSYRTCLPDVHRDVGKHRWGWTTEPDPRGFTDARSRLGAEPMVACAHECRDRALDIAKACAKAERGPLGRPIAAFDGTDILLFDIPGTRTRFGGPRDGSGRAIGQPHALMLSAWDAVHRIPLGWTMLAYGSDEREGARQLLATLAPEYIAVYDRGYPSRDFVREMTVKKRDFVMRMIAGTDAGWLEVRTFLRSGKRDQIVTMDLGEDPQHPGVRVLGRIRLIRKSFRKGRPKSHQKPETSVIATSLLEPEITAKDIVDVYSNRWSIETIHKELKMLCAMEDWHTTNPALLQQEIATIMIWQALAAMIQIQVQDAIAQRSSNAWNCPKRALAVRTMVRTRYKITVTLYDALSSWASRKMGRNCKVYFLTDP
jgi:hypothetical protein